MKIGLVCPYNMARNGGVQECVLALQTELTTRGHDVHILTPQFRGDEKPRGSNIVELGVGTDVKSFHTLAQIAVQANPDVIEQTLAAHKFDILHFHEPWIPIVSRQILSKSTSKNVATFHAKLPDTVMNRTIERVITPYTKSILKYIDSFTAVSSAAAEYISSLTDQTIHLVPNGIDLAKYTQTHTNKKPASILYIGRLEKRKGVKYLLKAFKKLTQMNAEAELLLVGDGPEREKLEELVHDQKIPNVSFLGFVSEARKKQLLASCAVFCSPARYGESFGIVLLEAMASDIPTVAGDNPGYTSVMQGHGAISLINPKDTDDFARRLQLFVYDEPLRKQWQAWASDYVQQFDYSKVIDMYENLYRNVLS